MDLQLLLWSIPAYTALIAYYGAKEAPHKGTWDFIVKLAPFGFTCFLIAEYSVRIGTKVCPVQAQKLRTLWAEFSPHPNSFKLLLSIFPTSLFVGAIIAPFLKGVFISSSETISKVFTSEEPEKNLRNDFCDALIKKPVLMSLKSGKVYVGLLTSTDSTEDGKDFYQITPIMSGHRLQESGQVVFDTNYIGAAKKPEDVPNRDLLIFGENLVTIAAFDTSMHEHFVNNGRTLVRF